MKKFLMSLITALSLLQVAASDASWLTDLPKAQAQAKAENKLVLMNFTGSDWCGFCIKLHKEVFSKSEFKEFAAKHLVLVEVDFPQEKKQSQELKKANAALEKKYKVGGYPTLVILNGDGKKLEVIEGYPGGGAKAFVDRLAKLKKS